MRATLNLPKLPSYLVRLQAELERIVASDNPQIDPILKRLVRSGGKRLRPSLLFAVTSSSSKKIDKTIIKAAAAIELVHLASLVHDDIMDEAQTRWGKPTINAKAGIGEAIVIGDFLLAKACQTAADINAQAATLIASTIAKICDGQSRELGDQHNQNRMLDSLLLAVEGKTASLFDAACQLGAKCAGYTPAQAGAFGRYGTNFGVSYQLTDDLLDLLSSSKLAGKPVGADASSGTYTMPLIFGLQGANGKSIKAKLQSRIVDATALTDLLIKNGSVDKSIQKINEYNQVSSDVLKALPSNNIITGLQHLPELYLKWVLKTQVDGRFVPSTAHLA